MRPSPQALNKSIILPLLVGSLIMLVQPLAAQPGADSNGRKQQDSTAGTLAMQAGNGNAIPDRPLRVAVTGSPPFSILEQGSEPAGIAVELWQNVADYAGLQYELVDMPQVPDAIEAVRQKTVDIAIGPISITEDRSRIIDFTVPYYHSYAGLATRQDSFSIWGIIAPFVSSTFIWAIVSLAVILFMFANLLWITERKANEMVSEKYIRGVGSGMWLALVTFTTVGYGDIAPRTSRGRLITGIWMLVAMVTASSLTAGIAATFTVFSLTHTEIQSVEDTANRKVAVLGGTTGESLIRASGGRITAVESIDEALDMLKNHKVDAIANDFPVLKYANQTHPDIEDPLFLIELSNHGEFYAFAIPRGSYALRDKINFNLLKLREDGILTNILRDWHLKN